MDSPTCNFFVPLCSSFALCTKGIFVVFFCSSGHVWTRRRCMKAVLVNSGHMTEKPQSPCHHFWHASCIQTVFYVFILYGSLRIFLQCVTAYFKVFQTSFSSLLSLSMFRSCTAKCWALFCISNYSTLSLPSCWSAATDASLYNVFLQTARLPGDMFIVSYCPCLLFSNCLSSLSFSSIHSWVFRCVHWILSSLLNPHISKA